MAALSSRATYPSGKRLLGRVKGSRFKQLRFWVSVLFFAGEEGCGGDDCRDESVMWLSNWVSLGFLCKAHQG